ncbi:MAG: hypothetical protein GX556_17235 [Fibrobacter sp.]|nr:hypothetical protein [Fibrobacter sp.]
MKLRVFITLTASILLLRCTNPSSAGGSGTETINTFVALAGGVPASGAAVKVVDSDGWFDSIYSSAAPVLESTTVAENGMLSFDISPSRVFNLQIDNGKAGRFLYRINPRQIDKDTLFLDSVFTFEATVDSALAKDVVFRLSGTTYKAKFRSPDKIEVTGIPQGTYTLVASGGAAGKYPVILKGLDISADVPDTQLQLVFNNTLVDDFQTGIGPSTAGNLNPDIYWYTYSDGGAHGWNPALKMWVEISDTFQSVGSSWINADSSIETRNEKAALFRAFLDHSIDPPWAGAGINMKSPDGKGIDLSSMESFSFRARGRGTVTVRLETAAYDRIASGHSQFSSIIYLTDTWQVYTIPVTSLNLILPLDSQYQFVPWEEASKEVTKVEFEFSGSDNPADSVELYIDDIYINGVRSEAFR